MSVKKPAFIVVEGCNGTGKSETARHLATLLGAHTFHFPPKFNELRASMGLDTAMPQIPRLHYYLAACLHLSNLVLDVLEDGGWVVCDRYVAAPLSLIAADGGLDPAVIDAQFGGIRSWLLDVDVTLVLEARHQVAVERLVRRRKVLGSPATPVERRCENKSFYERRERFLRRYARMVGPVVTMDTSDLQQAEMLDVAAAMVSERTPWVETKDSRGASLLVQGSG